MSIYLFIYFTVDSLSTGKRLPVYAYLDNGGTFAAAKVKIEFENYPIPCISKYYYC